MTDLSDDTELLDPATEAELVSKHGPGLRAIRTAAGTVVLKRVKRDVYKRFREMALNPKTHADAGEWLARAACVYPDAKALMKYLDEYPGISVKMSNIAAQLVGQEADDSEGKKLGD